MKDLISVMRKRWQQTLLALIPIVVLAVWSTQSETAFGSLGQDQPDGPGEKNTKVTRNVFTYQGQLKDAGGPVNGAYDFQFRVYSSQTAGEQVASIDIKDLLLTNGLFSIQLDFGPANFDAKESWLEIGVRPSGSNDPYTVLSPRQKLTPVPYAIFAQHEQWSLIGVPVGFTSDRDKSADIMSTDGRKISIADVEARLAKLSQKAPATIRTGTGRAMTVEESLAVPCFPQVRCSNPDTAFSAVNIGSGHGVYASSMGSGLQSGIVGDNLNQSAGGYGVSGYSFGFAGVFGFGKAATSNGVYGNVNNREGSGVLGRNDGDNPLGSWGVFGFSPKGFAGVFGAGGQNGVFGQTNNKDAFGVYGKNDNGGTGVFGQVVGANGTGVLGRYDGGDNSSGGWGVFGFSPRGYAGVFGSGGKNGVFGVTSSNTDSGVFGKNDGSGFGVFGQALGRDGVGVLGRYDGPATGAGWGVFGFSERGFAGVFGTVGAEGQNGVFGQSGNSRASGIYGKNVGSGWGVFGESVAGGVGVQGKSTGGVGVVGDSATGFAMQAKGHATQDPNAGGWVKAMTFVDPSIQGSNKFLRCYNSQATGNNVATSPCGFVFSSLGLGRYIIDFGFRVDNRFVSVTPACGGGCPSNRPVVVDAIPNGPGAPNEVFIKVAYTTSGDATHSRFFIFVY